MDSSGVPPLGGSATTQLAMIRNYIQWGFGLVAPLKMSTAVPARIIGESKRGLLRAGNIADLMIMDQNANLLATIIAGQIVHQQTGFAC